jgi:hypothetical protein
VQGVEIYLTPTLDWLFTYMWGLPRKFPKTPNVSAARMWLVLVEVAFKLPDAAIIFIFHPPNRSFFDRLLSNSLGPALAYNDEQADWPISI